MRHLILIPSMIIALSAAASGATYLVCPDGSGDFLTIQEAIVASDSGDIVELCSATFTGDGNRDIDYGGKAITVRSQSGNPEACIIDCQGSESDLHRGFYFHSGEDSNSVLQGVTITNGYVMGIPTDNGGAVLCCSTSSPTITNCRITSSRAFLGGGICCMFNSSPTITNCTIMDNWGSEVGGIECYEGSHPKITNCTIAENQTSNRGGGIDCMFSSNPTIINCLIRDNTANYNGSGIMCREGSPTVINCTLAGNITFEYPEYAGCIYCGSSSNPTITNCILWGDTPQEIYVSGGAGPVVSYSDIQGGWPGAGNINVDPLFVNPGGDNYHLSTGSACIDTGSNAAVPPGVTTDLEGNPRIVDGNGNGTATVDMGAYEAPAAPSLPALSEWGLVVLVVLLVLSTWVVLRRRKAVVSRQ